MEKSFIIFLILIILGVTGYSAIFIVNEGEQALVVQFGEPIRDIVTKAGLHLKVPWMHEVRFFDKRILTWDGEPNQIPTRDKKYISVETTARWRIVDALKFYNSVQDENHAEKRLNAIIDAATRDVISNHNLVEAVRNTNSVFDYVEELRKKDITLDEVEVVGEVEKIAIGRERLSTLIAQSADEELRRDCGISIIDVQIKRISYEKSVEQKVYERMISERQRIAEQIRSIGEGEKAKIQGRLNKDLQTIQSEAYRSARLLEGKAEAEATDIYREALAADVDFYDLVKTLEVYRSSLNKETDLILTPESELFKYFKSSH